MKASIIPLRAERRPVARAQCDAVTLAEAAAIQYVRWWSAITRDWLRWAWGV